MSGEALDVFAPGILSDQCAVITGGGSGIGAGIALAFAKHGANIALIGRTREKLEAVAMRVRSMGRKASVHPCDVRDAPALESAITEAASAFGRLDVLVCSAAGNFLAPASSLSANGFRAVVDIDLCGTFNACRAVFPHLSKRGGTIVNITANQADLPMPLQVHAGAAKAGIAKLTRDLALEWGRFGIRVVAVSPGPIAGTEGMSRLAPGDVAGSLEKRLPLGRYGTADEIAAACMFLVSRAGAFVTGTTLCVDGGMGLVGAGPFLDLMQA